MNNPYKPNINDFYLLKPTSEYKKEFPPTDQEPECFCLAVDRSKKQATCPRCLAQLFLCCLKVNGICVRCNQRTMDPVNIFEEALTEVFFNTESVFKVATTLFFQFRCNLEQLKRYSVQVRCMRPGKGVIQFPMMGTLDINEVELIVLKPLIKNSNMSFRKDSSAFISPQHISQLNILKLVIPQCKPSYNESYQSDNKQQYYFLGVYLVQCQTYPELIERLMKTSCIGIKEVKQRFFNQIGGGEDQPQMSRIRVALRCPLTLLLMSVPGRGSYCQHLNPFCIKTLYASYSAKRKWNCPICSRQLNQLVIDNWLWQMIKNRPSDIETYDVEVDAQGNYKWVVDEKENQNGSDSDISQRYPLNEAPVSVVTARKTIHSQANLEIPTPQLSQLPLKPVQQHPKPKKRKTDTVLVELSDQSQKEIPVPVFAQRTVHPNNNVRGQRDKKHRQCKSKSKVKKMPRQGLLQEQQVVVPVLQFQQMSLQQVSKVVRAVKEGHKIQQPTVRKKKQYIDQFKNLFKIH